MGVRGRESEVEKGDEFKTTLELLAYSMHKFTCDSLKL